MHAKKFVTSTQEQTHTPHLVGRATDDGQISWLLQPVKSQDLGWKGAKRRNAFQTGAKIYLSETNILGLGAL